MPVMNGKEAAKTIRDIETRMYTENLSTTAQRVGRIPLLAISASIGQNAHKELEVAGFDGWMLKPVSFSRLSAIFNGIADEECRKQYTCTPGQSEDGGWFAREP